MNPAQAFIVLRTVMLKFLLILFLVGYVLFKVGGIIFRMFLGGLGAKGSYQNAQANNRQQQQRKTTAEGISIEYAPEDKNQKSAANFKGGEYVDYEELK